MCEITVCSEEDNVFEHVVSQTGGEFAHDSLIIARTASKRCCARSINPARTRALGVYMLVTLVPGISGVVDAIMHPKTGIKL
jgi:hypothetical protein